MGQLEVHEMLLDRLVVEKLIQLEYDRKRMSKEKEEKEVEEKRGRGRGRGRRRRRWRRRRRSRRRRRRRYPRGSCNCSCCIGLSSKPHSMYYIYHMPIHYMSLIPLTLCNVLELKKKEKKAGRLDGGKRSIPSTPSLSLSLSFGMNIL